MANERAEWRAAVRCEDASTLDCGDEWTALTTADAASGHAQLAASPK